MRGEPLILAIATLSIAAFPVDAASSDVAFEGGVAACVHTPHRDHATGTAEAGQYAIVAADAGTVTIRVVGERVGIKDDQSCTFDVAITGGEPVGLDATSPRASVTGATSSPCTAASHAACVASATAEWSVNGLSTRAQASASAAPTVPTDVDVHVGLTSFPSPSNPPSGALGVDVLYEIGVTGTDGARVVVATGSVRIWDAPAAVGVQGNDVP